MQTLQELIQIVTKNKLSSVEVFSHSCHDKLTKMEELYDGIISEHFADDITAANQLYHSGPKNPNYQKIKRKLKKRLLNALFFIDANKPSYTERQKAYYECYKDWAAVKILLGKNARLTGIEICLQLIKIATKFEFTELVLDIARTLRLHYGTREGHLKRYEKYNKLYNTYKVIWDKENRVEELYTELTIRYVNNKATKKVIHEKALAYYSEVAEIMGYCDSYRIRLCGNLIRLIQYTAVNDYKSTIDICRQAINYFESKPYTAAVPLQICYYQLMICYVQIKDYQNGFKVAQKCLAMMEEGSFNWFKYKELHLTLALHTKQYQAAYDLFCETVEHNRFRFLPNNIKEAWKLFGAYIHYLIDINTIQPSPEDTYFNKFRLGRFLNEVPIFSKDKRGMNIPVLVIQILFMILQNKYDQAIDRIEGIEKYCSRYLIKDDTFRSNCFIKLLLTIPQSSFHKAAVERKAEKYLKKLSAVPMEVANQSHEIEIIPYEDLWQLGLETLECNFLRTRKQRKSSVA